MRLLRMTTTDPNCIFDTTLNQDLTIQPNAHLALKNLTVETDNTIAINGANDRIEYQLVPANPVAVCHLTHRSYPDANQNALLEDIQFALNKGLPVLMTNGVGTIVGIQKNLGIQWRVLLEKTKVVKIQFVQALSQDFGASIYQPLFLSQNLDRTAAGVYSKTDLETNAYAANKLSLAKGWGIFRLKLSNFPANNGDVVLAGLTSKNPHDNPPSNATDFFTCIEIRDVATNYNFFPPGGVVGDLGFAPLNNDYVEFTIQQGRLKAYSYRNDPALPRVEVLNVPYDGNTSYYPAVCFAAAPVGGTSDPRISTVRFTGDPFELPPTDDLPADEDFTGLGAIRPTTQRRTTHQGYLALPSPTVAAFLGYDQSRFPASGTVAIGTTLELVGTNRFSLLSLADSFIVEMLNMELDSYDTSQLQRKNILMTIPEDEQDQRLLYDTEYPIFISLKNKNPITLRNIRARVLREDYSPLTIVGQSTMTLLLEN